MTKKILVMDTSFLCSWLCVPGKETCGPASDRWDSKKVEEYINDQTQKGATIMLPIATIIETGNHISQSTGDRYGIAITLGEILLKAADQISPWAAFTDQQNLWPSEELKKLAAEWPNFAAQRISIADTTIKKVADYYASSGTWNVEILTGDEGLKSYQPQITTTIPRRKYFGCLSPPGICRKMGIGCQAPSRNMGITSGTKGHQAPRPNMGLKQCYLSPGVSLDYLVTNCS